MKIVIVVTVLLGSLCPSLTEEPNQLRLHIATWNVAEGTPPATLDGLLGLDKRLGPLPDIIVVGLQEVTMNPGQSFKNTVYGDVWTHNFTTILAMRGYERIRTVQMLGIVLNVFVSLDEESTVTDVNIGRVRTGLGGFFGNKGGVLISLGVHGKRLRFINAHLPAHDHALRDRIDDYKWIRDDLHDPQTPDYSFWLGDLNFRLEDPQVTFEDIRAKVESGDFKSLLKLDQLRDVMSREIAFSEYQESDIDFPPTFKLVPGKDEYTPKRRPAWTDRILYVQNDGLQSVAYTSLQDFKSSDHRPVVAQFIIDV